MRPAIARLPQKGETVARVANLSAARWLGVLCTLGAVIWLLCAVAPHQGYAPSVTEYWSDRVTYGLQDFLTRLERLESVMGKEAAK